MILQGNSTLIPSKGCAMVMVFGDSILSLFFPPPCTLLESWDGLNQRNQPDVVSYALKVRQQVTY